MAADKLAYNATGSENVATDKLTGGHVQLIKLMDGTDGGTDVIPGTAANGLLADVKRVQGVVTVIGNLSNADTTIAPTTLYTTAFGMVFNGATWDKLRGTVANGLYADLRSLAGTTIDVNSGNKSAGTQRIVLATDQPNLTTPLNVNVNAVTGAVTAADGASNTFNAVNVQSFPMAFNGATWDRVRGSAANGLYTDLRALAGTTIATNTGNASAGCQRMVLASDQPTVAVSLRPAASGGNSCASNRQTSGAVYAAQVKGSAGQVYGVSVFNADTAPVFVRLYNMTGAPASTDGASIVWSGMVPAGGGLIKTFPNGLACGTGIGIRITKLFADNDATALTANTVMSNVVYT